MTSTYVFLKRNADAPFDASSFAQFVFCSNEVMGLNEGRLESEEE